MTTSQIDKLGDRLKSGKASEADLRMLAEYRTTFSEPFARLVSKIESIVGSTPTAREAKTTGSIVAKLQRERTRLSRMQDIAGCRLIIADIAAQDDVCAKMTAAFTVIRVIDRRGEPKNGYRAVHLLVQSENRTFEIQIRTELQQLWAEFSEKIADEIDRGVKYGAGPDWVQSQLMELSTLVDQVEEFERDVLEAANDADPNSRANEDYRKRIENIRQSGQSLRRKLRDIFTERYQLIMDEWDRRKKEGHNAILD
ncbi:MAG TPA: RelA/SpoT domain-containing protein [Tepidisphaeraceae bacterium]|jgi:ppGpp synthetase/RelA/SpoT-type nucleotidyltranferase|nr:RelA/SpoT domain-containing protein [Tepidisphaeraceae bacterium]